jgi:hypothetical protein
LAHTPSDNRVLTSLDVSSKDLGRMTSKEGWVIDGDGNYISPKGKYHGKNTPDGVEFKPFGVIALANVIPDMGALRHLDVSSNSLGGIQAVQKIDCTGDRFNVGGTAEYNGKNWTIIRICPNPEFIEIASADGVTALASAIKNMGAISSVNLLKNAILVEQAQELVKIMQSKEKLITLCGLSKEGTKLNFSGQGLGPGDAVLIANDISDMGTLTSLDISKNKLYAEGTTLLAEALKSNQIMTALNISSNHMTYDHYAVKQYGDMSGVVALTDVIPDMGALTSLDISGNMLVGQKGTGRYKSESVEVLVGYFYEREDHDVEVMEPDYRGIEALAHASAAMGL